MSTKLLQCVKNQSLGDQLLILYKIYFGLAQFIHIHANHPIFVHLFLYILEFRISLKNLVTSYIFLLKMKHQQGQLEEDVFFNLRKIMEMNMKVKQVF